MWLLRDFPPFCQQLFFFLFQDSEFFPGTEAHKKKRKHSSDEFCYRGKVVIKQGKRLTHHDFIERMFLNQCHQALWLAFYRRRVHQPALEQVIKTWHRSAPDSRRLGNYIFRVCLDKLPLSGVEIFHPLFIHELQFSNSCLLIWLLLFLFSYAWQTNYTYR